MNRPIWSNVYLYRPFTSQYGKRSADALPVADAEADADAYYPYYYNWNLGNSINRNIYGNTLNNFHQNRPVPNNIYFSRPALLSQYMSYYGKRSAEALPAAEAEAEADAYYPYYYNWNLVNRNNWNMYGNTMNNVYQRPVTSNRISNRPSMLLQYTNYYGKRSDEQIGHE